MVKENKDGIRYLSIGDKVRINSTGEAGVIVSIINEGEALIELFDSTKQFSSQALSCYRPNTVTRERFAFRFNNEKTPRAEQSTTYHEVLNERQAFPDSIDLHAEKLLDNIEAIHPAEILPRQLGRLKNYLDQASERGLKQVIIIHGHGSGRLKEAVYTLLEQSAVVKNFNQQPYLNPNKGSTTVQLF